MPQTTLPQEPLAHTDLPAPGPRPLAMHASLRNTHGAQIWQQSLHTLLLRQQLRANRRRFTR